MQKNSSRSKIQQTHRWVEMLLLNDCEPEETLDFITQEAASLFKVPIAMINLVTSKQIIFKACFGLKQADTLDNRGVFCAMATDQDELLIIPDALSDSRTNADELVTGPMQIRSYLGKALHAPDGSRLGTLCLFDTKPRTYSLIHQRAFLTMATRAEQQLQEILKPHANLALTSLI